MNRSNSLYLYLLSFCVKTLRKSSSLFYLDRIFPETPLRVARPWRRRIQLQPKGVRQGLHQYLIAIENLRHRRGRVSDFTVFDLREKVRCIRFKITVFDLAQLIDITRADILARQPHLQIEFDTDGGPLTAVDDRESNRSP